MSLALGKEPNFRIVNDFVLVFSNTNTTCYSLPTGKKIWENKELGKLFFTKVIDGDTAIGSIDQTFDDTDVELMSFSLKKGNVLNRKIYSLGKTFADETTTNILPKDVYGGKFFFLANDWIECFDDEKNKVIWKQHVTPPYLPDLEFSGNLVIFPETSFYESCASYDLTTKLFAIDINTG